MNFLFDILQKDFLHTGTPKIRAQDQSYCETDDTKKP